MVVTLRSGQVLKDPTTIQNEVNFEKESEKKLKGDVDKKNKGPMKTEKKKEENSIRAEHDESKHMSALPFTQNLSREKLDKQFERFLDVLKQVHVNLPFTEMLSQMSAYAKFLKEILTKNRKIEEISVEIGEIRSTPISLQLTDQTTLIPEGIVEDVLVRVNKFVFPVDFIMVNMKENKEIPPHHRKAIPSNG
ncbi:uncharacterized protein LOC142167002 [Nicotiana tabacum]|uniref:Uncharacterized protein LOC142167002 n=1 Tax=Nicotiana tabacum TaxID=4097 RepID=A0AC58SE54_TOBAC